LPWALSSLGAEQAAASELVPVAGDASSRRYFRATIGGCSYVLAESPPATEKNEAFLARRELLENAGVRVPALYGADLERGFLLQEDLGDSLLLPLLDDSSVERYYGQAFDILLRLATVDLEVADVPPYDAALLGGELGLFRPWFVEQLLGCELQAGESELLERMFSALVDSALAQPRVLVHRDFHSRNLLLMPGDELAVIDFQDAVVGPLTYDLVSLLRDCYRRWPPQKVDAWALAYRKRLLQTGVERVPDAQEFLRGFDWMGLQRHLKVLGIFARLYRRDGKRGYLADLPLVIDYTLEILDKYAASEAAFGDFGRWFRERLSPVIASADWSSSS
jgi:aminoglycoside/choline kinase family phosphotransferase